MATTARLKFLDEAANLLAFASPTTAAHLRSTRLESTTQNEVVKQNNRKTGNACGGCGESLIPGWNCTVIPKKRTRQERLNQDTRTKSTSVQCSRCHSFTILEQARRHTGRPASQQLKVLSAAESRKALSDQVDERSVQHSSAPPPSATDAGVKKRNRNKKSSLQSLLAGVGRKAAEPAKRRGLDLMDFMKD